MADYKFFNIGKANAEIARLESELLKVQAEAKTTEDNAAEVTQAAEKLQADYASSAIKIASLEADLKAASDKLASIPDQIKVAASKEAAKITAAQGQPPLNSTPAASAQGGDLLAQYNSITDSTQKVVFYRKHKAAIDAAFSANTQ